MHCYFLHKFLGITLTYNAVHGLYGRTFSLGTDSVRSTHYTHRCYICEKDRVVMPLAYKILGD